jgi:hypothetical protein
MGVYNAGTAVRLSVSFTVGGSAADPATVIASTRNPLGVSAAYSYALSTITKDSTGHYHFDFTPTVAGSWAYSWTGGAGAVVTVAGEFHVNALP